MSLSKFRKFCPKKFLLDGKPLNTTSIPLVHQSQYEYDAINNSLLKKSSQTTTSGQQLIVNQQALHLLKSIKKPVAVLAICGPYRTGKSYFLSKVLSVVSQQSSECNEVTCHTCAFEVGHTMKACTHGIWMATSTIDCDDFEIILLDTEGIGATGRDATDTTNLLVMTVLLSSYLIYNSKNVPTQGDLSQLSKFSELSSQISPGAECEEEDLRHIFPNFLWLLRDVSLELSDDYSSPTEYLKREVLIRSDCPSTTPNDDVVRVLTCLFPSIECSTVPQPPGNPKNSKENEDWKYFHTELQGAIIKVLDDITVKKPLDDGSDIEINGCVLATLAEEYIHAINEPGFIPDIQDSWKIVIKAKITELKEQKRQMYKNGIEKMLEGKLPLEEVAAKSDEEESTLFSIHNIIQTAVCDDMAKELRKICPMQSSTDQSEVIDSLKSELAVWNKQTEGMDSYVSGGILKPFAETNLQSSKAQCLKTFLVVHDSLQEKVSSAFEATPVFTLSAFQAEVELLKTKYEKLARGPARFSVYQQEARAEIQNKYEGKLPPNAVTNIVTRVNDDHSLDIQWVDEDNEGISVDYYEVKVSYDRRQYNERTQGNICSLLIPKYKVHGKHRCSVTVRAVTLYGQGEWSTPVVVNTIPAHVPNKPSAPKVIVLSHMNSKVKIDLPCSEDMNGSTLTHVIIENEDPNSSITTLTMTYENFVGKDGVIIKVDNEMKRKFRIRLKTDLGQSEASDEYQYTDSELVLPPPSEVHFRRGHNWIALKWDIPDYQKFVRYYSVGIKRVKDESAAEFKEAARSFKSKVKIQELKADTKYILSICTFNTNRIQGRSAFFFFETKMSKAARVASATGAGIGAAALTPLSPLLLAAGLIGFATTEETEKVEKAALASTATATLASTPITVPLATLLTPIVGPIAGAGVGMGVYDVLDSDKDFSDSEGENSSDLEASAISDDVKD